MGLRGPPPKPTALKELEGNPGKRRLPSNEPKIEEAPLDVPPPAHLCDAGKMEWARLFPILQSCGLMTLGDLTAFAVYCSLYGRWHEAEEQLKVTAKILKTPNGSAQPNPWITISRQTAELMKGYLIEFGLTPASRARMGTPEPPGANSGASKSTPPAVGGKFAGLIGKPN